MDCICDLPNLRWNFCTSFLISQLKHEVWFKFLNIVLDLTIEVFGAVTIDFSQIHIKHYANTPDIVYKSFQQVLAIFLSVFQCIAIRHSMSAELTQQIRRTVCAESPAEDKPDTTVWTPGTCVQSVLSYSTSIPVSSATAHRMRPCPLRLHLVIDCAVTGKCPASFLGSAQCAY